MGYMKIPNLYKDDRIFDYDECYALEKIHGTSAHISYKNGTLKYFSGGANYETFKSIFNEEMLIALLDSHEYKEVTIYGEAYGGKMQGMRDTYGNSLRFVAFDILLNGKWLNVEEAHGFCISLGLDFVEYKKGPVTEEWLNSQRDLPSRQAIKLGIGNDKKSEGIVIKPLEETIDRRGNRIITKHKRSEFRETRKEREIRPEKLYQLKIGKEIANEWVTEMRLNHVLDKLNIEIDYKNIPQVIKAMILDIREEGEGEIEWSKDVNKAIGKETVKLYKRRISNDNKSEMS